MRRPTLVLDQLIARDDFPSVDVMIPCYSEPLNIIEETAAAACQLDYPRDKLKILVLDDSGRDGKSTQLGEWVLLGLVSTRLSCRSRCLPGAYSAYAKVCC